jgi:Transposase DDE domain group 1
MNTGFRRPSIPFRSIHRLIQSVLSQLNFSFYRHQSIRADFSGGQITSDAGLLPLRAFDQRHALTRELARHLRDPRQCGRVRHSGLSLLRQRVYQIVAGYEDANDADRLRYDPTFQLLADQPLGQPLSSQPTLSRWENTPSARELVCAHDGGLDAFVRLCGRQVRQRGEILLDVDSTDDPTYGQQQLSFFNGAYNQHMYHPLLIFERHTGCLLAARLRRGTASSHARIVPLLLRVLRRLLREFPGVPIRLRADAGFALPLLYKFCEFFGIHYTIGIPTNVVFRRRTAALQRRLAGRYRRTHLPQRSFTSFRHRARTWPRLRRIVAKAEHSATGTNLRFLVTNCPGRSAQIFRFYNERGECENRIEEFKNGFHADRLSCHRFLANAFRLLLHTFAYNLVNWFRLHLPSALRSAQIETLRTQLFKIGARVRQTARCVRIHLASGWPFQSLFQTVAQLGDTS